ncbi:hypothetical protein FJTKL_05266 [Diaporthe vaccinii]|uniref:lytic cellulose monooxygenase (C4-dehydrogenating) n=1 Tax=Diaporthe vaccinii TaxID=105482 RepID=A0ABR4FF82_9PEZI
MNLLAAVIFMAAAVTAHGHVTNMVVNGVSYRNFLPNTDPYNPNPPKVMGWTAGNTDNGYVAPDAFQSPDIICHRSAAPGKAHVAVQAGDSISIQWDTWPESHHGPVIDYLASCNGPCETVDKNSLKFFKIDGFGLVSGSDPGYWADDVLMANGLSWLVKIPEDIAPGNYVLRHEIIALHGANQADGAQAYPQCFNLEISGTGTSQPSEQVECHCHVHCDDTGSDSSGTHNLQDLNLDINYSSTHDLSWQYLLANVHGSYEPGLHNNDDSDSGDCTSHYKPSSDGGPNTVCVPGPVADGDGQTLYGQCGGQNWSGKTSCQPPATCSVFHRYYAQCLY